MDFPSGERRDLKLPGGEKAAVGPFEFAGDASKAYIATDAQNEFKRLALLDRLLGRRHGGAGHHLSWRKGRLCRGVGDGFGGNEEPHP